MCGQISFLIIEIAIRSNPISLGTDEIVDLCSGTGGPLIKIQHDMKKYEQFDVKVRLTDLYPPTKAVQKEIAERSQGHVQYHDVSIH